MEDRESPPGWRFWIDRGGTFTDLVALSPGGELVSLKLLSDSPLYPDAAIEGIRRICAQSPDEHPINEVRMGTTVGTNALLEGRGEPTLLVITEGFEDALEIGYQNRPDIFALRIERSRAPYMQAVGASERLAANGSVVRALDEGALRRKLQKAYDQGLRSCAIVFLHSYRNPAHELAAARIAGEIGFDHISCSSDVSPLIKLVRRGDTTVVDAYLSPVLEKYTRRLRNHLKGSALFFMQSHGGLVPATEFRGRDCLLSGPAGGVVGGVQVGLHAGFERIIGFDMGGTSTDVWHYRGQLERTTESEIAGVRLQTPILRIHTVAAGGGSILKFDHGRFQVGPQSSGAQPGPLCYGNQGPLSLSDANLLLGRLQARLFPHIFGPDGTDALDERAVVDAFSELAARVQVETGLNRKPEEVALGFFEVAVESMANAIRKISLQRGYDPADYVLATFGGAGGQHCCAIASRLGIRKILVSPLAGVLSAYGMGAAERSVLLERYVGKALGTLSYSDIQEMGESLAQNHRWHSSPGVRTRTMAHLKYSGYDQSLPIAPREIAEMVEEFRRAHERLYGFDRGPDDIRLESILVELALPGASVPTGTRPDAAPSEHAEHVRIFLQGRWMEAPLYDATGLSTGSTISGPAFLFSPNDTLVLEPDWQAEVRDSALLLTQKTEGRQDQGKPAGEIMEDPVLLEIYNHRFRAVAEEMGTVLQQTASSVNIKERLDFSCAIFDDQGRMVANAPHIPVHLGSMSETVQAIQQTRRSIERGQVFVTNDPYRSGGGTHLPDITVVTPVFLDQDRTPSFFVASRGHHADIGGITPGSMPSESQSIAQEGVLIPIRLLAQQDRMLEDELRAQLKDNPYPARNPEQNLADLRAQMAANERGRRLLMEQATDRGRDEMIAYMGFVRNNAAAAVRRVIRNVKPGSAEGRLDNGLVIRVQIEKPAVDCLRVNFAGTSEPTSGNFNAPPSVVKAALIYVFRSLVNEDIPLNSGCLEPIEIKLPELCFLNPDAPAAVVAGNVETSQVLVDTLYRALGVLADSQGTMNNLSFGNQSYQYYETIGGGSGAGQDFDGASGVQVHMTNSRITDAEVLEERFPVRVEEFSLRHGSGGAGRHHGGDGLVRRIRFLEDAAVSVLSNRRVEKARGLAGGKDGKPGRNRVLRKSGETVALSSCQTVPLQAGDQIVIETPGGGGFGDPDEAPNREARHAPATQ
ncbi:MAG: hydantoinase B/oxoprolinase family protein [Spirochaetales bacterium]|nr:hydantoinase B/oxoprolinase family protein [Leptospiraceae bacterium]MCP5480018.1 hydantoinase B/oxoprolinase family protein [Spirochaetales bacterium]MCP5485641.1 hydantoinase B/oxoprolinase family protein [Spirochaetales bacterium]